MGIEKRTMMGWRRWAAGAVALAACPGVGQAQAEKPSKKAAVVPVVATCPGGVTVRVSPGTISQGSLAVIDVRSNKPLAGVKGDWGGRELGFWKEPADPRGATNQPEHWRGLLGVDLDKSVGPQVLTVFAAKPGSDAVGCGATVSVQAGRYPTERLKVENQFVEPNEEQAARAKEEQARLRVVFDTVTPEKLWTGRFRLPLDGVKTGGNFGRRRVLNGKAGSPHGGVDFPAVTGTPVHASQAGQVAMAEPMFFSGNTVVVNHGLGIYTFYCHLSEISVKVGNTVAEGDLLGKVGATGRVTGPHLHWALSVNHARVNAMQILSVFGRRG
jgi:murein DD-endopeptidase MepM/ murein hydrolase activator NlpD